MPNRNASEVHDTLTNLDDAIWDIPSSPAGQLESDRKTQNHESAPKHSTPAQRLQSQVAKYSRTPEIHPPSDIGRSRSSSPDELAFILEHSPKNKPLNGNNDVRFEHVLPEQVSDDDSPLSSPPSSLCSPSADDGENEMDVSPIAPQPENLDQILPDLDIPQEVLAQLSQPVRRSFRERNAIQLHPYALEMAKYQRQMQERGIRPVRMAIQAQRFQQNGATDESQEQDNFDPNALRSSPAPEEYLPTVRSERHRRSESTGQHNRHLDQQHSPIHRVHSHKRRKKSYSVTERGAERPSESHARPQVVINTNTPPNGQQGPAVFDIPSSPPHSRSVSSFSKTLRTTEGFRFPLGFTPPPTTTADGDSNLATPVLDEPNGEELLPTGSSSGPDEESESDASRQSSMESEQRAEYRRIRDMQRRTRGVLPASWVRLNAEQSERQKASQFNRHGPGLRTDGKGIAKRIVRKPGRSEGATTQPNRALFDFGDFDESEEETQSTSNRGPVDDNVAERPTGRLEWEVSIDRDGDAMEDNRIDYMLAPISRNTSDPREKRKGLKRVKSKESSGQTERRLKKARLQRQTRLMDPSYGGRRTKQPSTRPALRLGILDAPDVAARPRMEQPQFLRIVARQARSRRDQGRQSPTRKFVQLGSRLDTADANESLRDWKRGAIPRAKSSRPQSKPRKRQALTNLPSGGPRATPVTRNPRLTTHPTSAGIETRPDQDDQPMAELTLSRDPPMSVNATVPLNTATDAAFTAQSERRGHQWIVRRNMPITSLRRNDPRPAPTSLAAPSESQSASRDMFNRSLTLLNRKYRDEHSSRANKTNLTLDRYISDKGLATPPGSSSVAPGDAEKRAVAPQSQPGRRRLKKHPPHRINLESIEFAQDQEPITAIFDDSDSPVITHSAPARPSSFSVGGLFNWQRSYSVDFGVKPLRDGTFFHESTFIGSGEFSRSLNVIKRDLDKETSFSTIFAKDQALHWGAWNELVSSGMGSVFDMMMEDVEKSASSPLALDSGPWLVTASHVYRSIITYVTEHLSFIDPVDRTNFVTRAMGLVFSLRDPMAAFIAGSEYNKNGLVRIACYNLLFANQIRQIASHDLVVAALAGDALNLVKTCAADTIALIFSDTGMAELQRLFQENKKPGQRDTGLRGEFPTAEAYLVTEQLLRSLGMLNEILNNLQTDVLTKDIARNDRDVGGIEAAWRGLFTLLPFNGMDNQGIAHRKTRFTVVHDNWQLVKKLLSPALDNYGTNSATQPISYNAYCRALFQRCYHLINTWGWRECRPILDTLYDFFAQNSLYNLKLEESRGSPSFLDELDQDPSLDVQPGEPCFHTLLKIIASGLRFLSERYNDKKVRNFAWRLLPNHGRVYPKEKPLRREDLDALRNHHDLLCTLYWVIPPGLRFRVETIRDLVHPASSHNETCSINLRAWARLVRFKLSTNEDMSELEPFASWHSFFVNELRQQHTHARKEIEAQSKNGERVSQHLIESTISQNQRPIESLLSMALGGMRTAVERAPSLEHALRLISKTPFESLLGLFNPKLARVNVVVSDALQVIMAYVQKDPTVMVGTATDNTPPIAAASTEDDSQEFEDVDWEESLDHALVHQQSPTEGIQHVEMVLHSVVFRLLSNCFGEDHCPEDAILLNVVDCWTCVAQILVLHKLREWDNFLDPVSVESWASLRETVQTRKFAPRFLAGCIEKDRRILSDSRILVMGIWLSSLVERSSMLKFQHHLTETLLNGNPRDSLLQNLPFTKDKKSERYTITLEELGQRRLSLISSVLSNMREHVLHLEASDSQDLNITKQDYSELLKKLMTAMRNNYQELGNGAMESAQGAYVDFVHRIIRFLQELTSDIRPVDPFFTDPAVFPLPSSDPRYIVAKLKRYEPKLSSSKELQTLTIFVQSIVERATMDGQHELLISQLHTAMKDTYESGLPNKPTLRAVLLQCVVPAYIELAFSNPSAWLLGLPIVKSVSMVFRELLFNLDTTDPTCVSSLSRIFDTVFQSSYRALRPLSNRPARLKDPAVLIMLSAFVEMISSSLVVVNYLDRATDVAEGALLYMEWFREFCVAASMRLGDSDADTESVAGLAAKPPLELPSDVPFADAPAHLATARRLAFEDHQSSLRNWSFHEGKYYYTRPGHDSKLVIIEPETTAMLENEISVKRAFEDATADFVDRVERFDLLPV
ncbi:uncharacterized protein N7482_004136 [Penicillium canariense]|uniref:Mus7/MMS22 family-domain-containing protein n=1 Tax=Penicillium canariense TaxID=189055 RepID=A0A9W9IBS9_9EURO|nr:uncharacterized protein N7482_004136 [Penicillium canariense]KAJ5168542.1 hypothetical protein N7482_004136 [Penicillium canariense]